MPLGVTVGRPGRDDVANPAQRAARPNPETRCDNQPEQPAQNLAIVKLADARKDETENSRQRRITHLYSYLRQLLYEDGCEKFAVGSGQLAVKKTRCTALSFCLKLPTAYCLLFFDSSHVNDLAAKGA